MPDQKVKTLYYKRGESLDVFFTKILEAKGGLKGRITKIGSVNFISKNCLQIESNFSNSLYTFAEMVSHLLYDKQPTIKLLIVFKKVNFHYSSSVDHLDIALRYYYHGFQAGKMAGALDHMLELPETNPSPFSKFPGSCY